MVLPFVMGPKAPGSAGQCRPRTVGDRQCRPKRQWLYNYVLMRGSNNAKSVMPPWASTASTATPR